MTTNEEIVQTRQRMQKAVEDLRRELAGVRTGRASLSLFDNIVVDYYGAQTPNQPGGLTCPFPSRVS